MTQGKQSVRPVFRRILGDERNYAGLSFVTPDMFGSYRYGSSLLNVTFDPGVPGELASATVTSSRRLVPICPGLSRNP